MEGIKIAAVSLSSPSQGRPLHSAHTKKSAAAGREEGEMGTKFAPIQLILEEGEKLFVSRRDFSPTIELC